MILGSLLQAGPVAQAKPLKRLTGTVEGIVVNRFDARIANASIKIENNRVKRTAPANGEGVFQIELPTGIYRITVYSPGFGLYRRESIKIRANNRTKLTIPLNVAAVGPCPKVKNKGKGIVICM